MMLILTSATMNISLNELFLSPPRNDSGWLHVLGWSRKWRQQCCHTAECPSFYPCYIKINTHFRCQIICQDLSCVGITASVAGPGDMIHAKLGEIRCHFEFRGFLRAGHCQSLHICNEPATLIIISSATYTSMSGIGNTYHTGHQTQQPAIWKVWIFGAQYAQK